MRASLSAAAITVGLLCFGFATQTQSSDSASGDKGAGSTYITHVTVIDTAAGNEAQDPTVVISGDRILEVKDSKKVKPASSGGTSARFSAGIKISLRDVTADARRH